jgi:lipopolysaccharide transport system permease protein
MSAELATASDESTGYLSPRRAAQSFFLKGVQLYFQGFLCRSVWLHMATSEIRRRYRRTLLGPFWTSLNVLIFIGVMGLVFPLLWHTNVKTYLPFFSSGFIIWTFVSTSIMESCGTFLDLSGLIKQVSLPYSVYANTVVVRNVIVLLHHLLVYVVIALIFQVPINLNTLCIIPALLILCLTGSWVSILLGLVVARFRDIKQLITSFLQIAMFVTPIFWMPDQLGVSSLAKFIIAANPLYHFVAIARAPLLGQAPSLINWVASLCFCLIGWAITMRLLGKYYRHLVFWL